MTQEENLDRLVSQLSEHGFYKKDMYSYLAGCIASGMDVIPLFQREQTGDDEMSYQLTIKKNESSGLYYPQGYQATLLQTYPIPHDIYAVIDTKKLERQMKEMDWNTFAVNPKSTKIFEEIFDLEASQNKQLQDISRRLQLRYWLHTPVEQHINIARYITDYQKSHYFPLNKGLADIHVREAYNLLCGRPVLKFYQKENEPQTFYSHWKVMGNDKLETLDDFNFMTALKALPILEFHQDSTGPQLVYNLIRGERCTVHLTDGDRTPLYLEVDAGTQSLHLYDEKMRPQNNEELSKKETPDNTIKRSPPQISPPKKRPGKNKGRSL